MPLQRETYGTFDSATQREDGVIRLAGWVAPLEPPGYVGLEVRMISGTEQVVVPDRMTAARETSPDVLAVHPQLFEADRARFTVAIPSDGTRPRFVDRLVLVTPLFADGSRGVPLSNLLTPTIPAPSEDAVVAVGGGTMVGHEVFCQLLARAGLTPDLRVLDVGCGFGRMAYPLAYFLSRKGSFCGFDVMADAIASARRAFASRRHFRFDHVDIFNSRYNPEGKLRGESFTFPYPDRSFDLLYLWSVFTHMLDREVERYLDEFTRVLAPGGRALVSAFLLNPETEALIAAGKSSQNHVHPLGAGKVVDPNVPEASIAFHETWVREQLRSRGFMLESVSPGAWCGRERWVAYQDILVFARAR